jgi:hypothetical protein
MLVRSFDTFGATFKKFKYVALKLFNRDLVEDYEKKMKKLANFIRDMVDKYGKTVFTDF